MKVMEILFKLVDLYSRAANWLAGYLPKSGDDLLQIFAQIGKLTTALNLWVSYNLGTSIQSLLAYFGKIIVYLAYSTLEIIKAIAARL